MVKYSTAKSWNFEEECRTLEKVLREELGCGEGNMLEKDNRELEEAAWQAFLRSILTMNLAYIAPLLSLARIVSKEGCNGVNVTIHVQDSGIFAGRCYSVVHLCTYTDIESKGFHKRIENVLYTFRNISNQVFEPFVCICRSERETEVFAYANNLEFLVEEINGNNEKILLELKKIAGAKKMSSLERFVDLIIRVVEKQADEGN